MAETARNRRNSCNESIGRRRGLREGKEESPLAVLPVETARLPVEQQTMAKRCAAATMSLRKSSKRTSFSSFRTGGNGNSSPADQKAMPLHLDDNFVCDASASNYMAAQAQLYPLNLRCSRWPTHP